MPTTTKKTAVKKSATSAVRHTEKYIERIGRRKSAVARVRLVDGKGSFAVNGKKLSEYFGLPRLSGLAMAPLDVLHLTDQYHMTAVVHGGGIHAQAEAIRLGLARTLIGKDDEFKKRLKKLGYMTRDSRKVERKKYGLKKARRGPQWSKR